MHTKGYGNIPGELFYYIIFLTRALPLRSAKTFIDSAIWILDIDDSIVLRHSKKAPMSQIHHQHGNKTNLSRYVRG